VRRRSLRHRIVGRRRNEHRRGGSLRVLEGPQFGEGGRGQDEFRAIANPHVDILGHCTGRLITGGRGTRPESEFDPEVVFEACRQFGTAVEINSRPERLDPPKRLLSMAVEMDCMFSIDTDAHAPGQLDWQVYGCERAEDCGVTPDRVINTWDQRQLVEWTAS